MSVPAARRWLEHVQRDLDAAFNCAFGPREATEAALYHLQQAAEKLLKSVLVAHGIDPPQTHNIGTLVRALPLADPMRDRLAGLVPFTPFATIYRYPGDTDPEPLPGLAEVEAWLADLTAIASDVAIRLDSVMPRQDSDIG
jgi:HEPN domain-containing protein